MTPEKGRTPDEVRAAWRQALHTFVLKKKIAVGDFDQPGGIILMGDAPPALPLREGIYKTDADYLWYTAGWENSERKQRFYQRLKTIRLERPPRVLDIGCMAGATGIELLLWGAEHVQFLDFEGVGLEFLREFLPTVFEQKRFAVAAYGGEQAGDLAIATDVLEHVGCEPRFLHWLSSLASSFAITYPLTVPFHAPYLPQVDNWVDDVTLQKLCLDLALTARETPANLVTEIVGKGADVGRQTIVWRP